MAQLRIVSLVPRITELVFALGRGDALVGRTRFCTEPEGPVSAVPIIGGTKNPRLARIVALAPDIVLANKEENRREDIEALRAAGIAVLLTDPNSVPEAVSMISEIGTCSSISSITRSRSAVTGGSGCSLVVLLLFIAAS